MIHVADPTMVDLRGKPIKGAQCRFDPELHTGPARITAESPEEREAREAVAISVCETCPLRLPCLEYAVATLPQTGVWAGFTAEEIAALAAISFGAVA
ncbi:WhiB family transcriptional regulator [Actinomadura sp. NEAU-AAG7]|uniref:WhiB family transcriptional regulator n=1 Tax=Actinomadura sp. NEAU-AAG7 TaxID=2839640 RepID=UPI001BE3FADA|nr:WhiB family transcriptional regulator [Actinomadura sp. NEAU-AAG7]MBT2210320.1 WhiB family transcriptional regulator [Actinomadura sp. NEAU-AAG7]